MNRYFKKGYTFSLNSVAGEYEVRDIIGVGSSCAVYLVDHINDSGIRTEHILKEYNPKCLDILRDENGCLYTVKEVDKKRFEDGLERFERGVNTQLELRKDPRLKNYTEAVVDLYKDNNTMYIDMILANYRLYRDVEEESLYDLMRRMKTLVKIVGDYHSLGYLHLDLKPENFFVRPSDETVEDVHLFDFDSVIRANEIETAEISYTQQWAALEQLIPNRRKNICAATDFFAIGEMIFYKLTGRHSTINERGLMMPFAFADNDKYFKDIDPKVLPLLKGLFRKTLCNTPRQRYQSADEFIKQLDKIIELCTPNRAFLKSSLYITSDFFVGRDREIEDIHKKLLQNQVLYLSGLGGIGKTELAKHYAKRYQDEYDTIFLVPYTNSITSLITDDYAFSICNFSRYTEESYSDYYERKLKKLNDLCDERTLVIIDNLDNDAEDISILSKLGCKLLITTRMDMSDFNFPQLVVEPLSDKKNIDIIFKRYYTKDLDESEVIYVDEIIEYIDRHTMTIELLAKQMMAGRIKPDTLLSNLKETGLKESGKENISVQKDDCYLKANAFEHIRLIFDLSGLNEDEIEIMAYLSLIPYTGILTEHFKDWCELDTYDTINSLVQQGWVRRDKVKDLISLHPVISDIVVLYNSISMEEHIPFLDNSIYYARSDKFTISSGDEKAYLAQLFVGIAQKIYKSKSTSPSALSFLIDSAEFYCNYGHYNTAIKIYKYVIEIRYKIYGEDIFLATLYNNLGEFHQRQRQYILAEECHKNAINIQKNNLGNSNLTLAHSYSFLGTLFYNQHKINLAKRFFKKSLKIRKKELGKNSVDLAESYNMLGLVYCREYKWYRASVCYAKAYEIYNSIYPDGCEDMFELYSNIAELWEMCNKFDVAEEYYLNALDLAKRCGNHLLIAKCYLLLSDLYRNKESYDLAYDCILMSLKLYSDHFNEEDIHFLPVYNSLAMNLAELGNYDQAKIYYLKSLNISQNSYGANSLETALIYGNLGALYSSQKKYDTAIDCYLHSQSIYEQVISSGKSEEIAVLYFNIGSLYFNKGELDKARDNYKQAYKIYCTLFKPNHPKVKEIKHLIDRLYTN